MSKKHNGELDFLRMAFCFSVVVFHWSNCFNLEIMKYGNLSVEFFFILSGLFMAAHACRENREYTSGEGEAASLHLAGRTWKFMIQKCKSFFAYYIAVFILQVIIRYVLVNGVSIGTLIKNFINSIPTLSLTFMGLNYSHASLYVGNTWYLSCMVIAMFLLYPMLLKFYDFSTKYIFPLISMFILGYMFNTYNSIAGWNEWCGFCSLGVLRAVAEIALGCSIYELSKVVRKKTDAIGHSLVFKISFTIVKIALYAIVFIYMTGCVDGIRNLSILFIIALAVMMSYVGAGFTIPDSKFTRYLSKISLIIFISHGFMRKIVEDIMGEEATVSMLQFWGFVALSIILSVGIMYLVDFGKIGVGKIRQRICKNSDL